MFSNLRYRLRALFRRNSMESELDEELRAHVEQQAEEYVQEGMSPEDAARRAKVEFGGIEQVKEECRDSWGVRFISELAQDLRYGLRQLRRNPGFTAVGVLTLALGIGAASAIFNVVDEVLLSPLPVPEPQQLVAVYNFDRKTSRYVSTSYPDFQNFSMQSHAAFQELAAYSRFPFNLTIGDNTERVTVEAVTGDCFAMLRLAPLVGRALNPEDAHFSSALPSAMIGENLWRGRFGSAPSLIGKTITLENHLFAVVGVVPKRYEGTNLNWGGPPQVWVPLNSIPLLIPNFKNDDILHQRAARFLVMLGRLRPGVGFAQAQSELRLIAANLAQAYPASNHDITVKAFPASRSKFWPAYRPHVTQSLAVFGVGALLLLLLACANVSNLLLERAFTRRREIAVRIAVGADRTRLVRQLLVENLVLVAVALPAALLVVHGLDGVLPRFPGAFGLPLAFKLQLRGRVLLFGFVLSLVTVLLFGLVPALQTSQPDITSSLKGSGDALLPGHRRQWLRHSLVTLQVAFSMILLVAGGVFVRSVLTAYRVNLGFRPANLLIMSYTPPRPLGRSQSLAESALRRISTLPGVETATVARDLPLEMHSSMTVVDPDNRNPEELSTGYNLVGPDYLSTLGISILAGRDFTWRDNATSAKVVVVNQVLAQRLWHSSNAVGRMIEVSDEAGHRELAEVVGLAHDSKYVSVWENPAPYMYLPAWQWQLPVTNLIVRKRQKPLALVREIRQQWRKDLPGIALYDIHSGDEQVQMSLAPEQLAADLLSSFAIIAAIVAAIGLYGVVVFSVSRRRREIGIRMALGAQRSDVLKMIVAQELRLALIGVAIGIAGALVLTRFLASMLYGVKPTDPLTFVAVSLILIAVALVACYIPARRAAKVDPMVALRYE